MTQIPPIKFSELKVIIADDSGVVLTSTRVMLRKMGFIDNNIISLKDARSCIFHLQQQRDVDLILSDYNFGNSLNGQQLLEEIRYYNLIKAKASAILLTGESEAGVVRSIIELNPDEYLLKPFNFDRFKKRLTNCIRRKTLLAGMYEAYAQGEMQKTIAISEILKEKYPSYKQTILRIMAQCYSHLELHKQAQQVCEEALEEKEALWSRIGLVNSLINLDQIDNAKAMLDEMLEQGLDTPEIQSSLAQISVKVGELPDAVKHLTLAKRLAPGNSLRDQIISNLCISVKDYESAITNYKQYLRVNINTHAYSSYALINLARRLVLYAIYEKSTKQRKQAITEAKGILSELNFGEDKEIMQTNIDLVAATIMVVEGQIKEGVAIMQILYKDKLDDFQHFYDWLFFCWIAFEMNFSNEFKLMFQRCEQSLFKHFDKLYLESCLELIKSLKNQQLEKTKLLKSHYNLLNQQLQHKQSRAFLVTCIEIFRVNPYNCEVCLRIIDEIGKQWPNTMTAPEVTQLLDETSRVYQSLSTKKDLEKIQFEQRLTKAREHVSSYIKSLAKR